MTGDDVNLTRGSDSLLLSLYIFDRFTKSADHARVGIVFGGNMERNAVVRKLLEYADGKRNAMVEFLSENDPNGACSPSQCATCSECSKQSKFLLVESNLPIEEGDTVVVFFPTYRYYAAIAITFVLPIILLFVGIYLGHGDEKKSLIFGGLFFAFSLLLAYIVDKKVKVKTVITRILERHSNG
jgi:positive regulator of sigma E activity